MGLIALGYIGVETSRLDDWSAFATRLLGMQQVDKARDRRAFRMDDRCQRLIVHGGRPDGLGFMGFEVAAPGDLDAIGTLLEAHGTRVSRASRALADERHVAELIGFLDPGGNPVELFW